MAYGWLLFPFLVMYTYGLTTDGCEDGWSYYNHMCYLMKKSSGVTHQLAQEVCVTEHSDLTSLWDVHEIEFLSQTFLSKLGHREMAWIGLRQEERQNNKYSWVWLDGSVSDFSKSGNPRGKSDSCGVLHKDGERGLFNCSGSIKHFICKKTLKMYYVVSDIFDNKYTSDDLIGEPYRLLFERVWPPKLEVVDNYLTYLAGTTVPKETDCAYRCFRADHCRAFSIECRINYKCGSYDCNVFRPAL